MSVLGMWLLSYGLGAAAFGVLTLLLVASARARARGRLLTLACAGNAVWCGLIALAVIAGIRGIWLDLAEAIRDGLWLLFIAWLLPVAAFQGWMRIMRLLTVVGPLSLIAFLSWQILTSGSAVDPVGRSPVFLMAAIALALWGVMLVEQVYRSADDDERWGLKYICVAVVMLFGYDFLMYSYALVYGAVSVDVWNARGAANVLLVPLIAVSLGRNPAWSSNLRLSHGAAFQTGTFILGGGYLLFIALASYYIRNFGGDWSNVLGVLFVVATLVAMSVVLLSGQVRARLRVMVKKHFFRYKYDYRSEWLGLTQRLSGDVEIPDPYQRAIRAVAHILDSPAGALWLCRDRAHVCVAQWNLAAAEDVVETDQGELAEFMRRTRWIVDLDEYAQSPSHYRELALPAWLAEIPRARLVIPLFFESRLLGFMLLAAPRVEYTLTWEDLDLFKTLGSQIGSFLGQQESHLALSEASQFEAFYRLTAFLMHDLKNIASQQSLILQNAHKHKRNPEFVDDMILTVESSVQRMHKLLEQLQRASSNQDQTRKVGVGGVIDEVLSTLADRQPQPTFECVHGDALVRLDPERFAMVLGHVIRNAQEAAGPEGDVTIAFGVEDTRVRIDVRDNGPGMTAKFLRESLFKPFVTTKVARGMGIGAYQARDFVRAAGGDVEVASQPGRGTTFTLLLPCVGVPRSEDRRVAAVGAS